MNGIIYFSTGTTFPSSVPSYFSNAVKKGAVSPKKPIELFYIEGSTAHFLCHHPSIEDTEEMQHIAAGAVKAFAPRFPSQKSFSLKAVFHSSTQKHKHHFEKGMLLSAAPSAPQKSDAKKQPTISLPGCGTARLRAVTAGMQLQRKLTTTPANMLGIAGMIAECKKLAKAHSSLRVKKVLTAADLKKQRMALHLAVGAAGSHPPSAVIMEYAPAGTTKDEPVILVGKGLVFDTGGYNLKPTGYIADMMADKGGACTVLGIVDALCRMKTKQRVVAIVGLAENMIDSKAMRPGDIYTARNGKTVEVDNTDAEGRLVLADCMDYIQSVYPKHRYMFDFATLTGACVYCFGEMYTGAFTDNEPLFEKLSSVGKEVNDWVLTYPLDKFVKKMVQGKRSDLTNSSKERMLGHAEAAAFLRNFVKDPKKWVHFDIAGTGMRRSQARNYDIAHHYGSAGAVHLVTEFIARLR